MKYLTAAAFVVLVALLGLSSTDCILKKKQAPVKSSSKYAHPPGSVVKVTNAEGNLLQPGNVYEGDWVASGWYTFTFELKKMTAVEILAFNERAEAGKVDVKLSQKGEEFYTSMTSNEPEGPQALRLPEGKYRVTIVISVEADPQKTGKWSLSMKQATGGASLKVAVPYVIQDAIWKAFPGGLRRLALAPPARPGFDFVVDAWTWPGTKEAAMYAREATPLFPYDTAPEDVLEGKGAVLQLTPGEPVLVYELVDVFAARVFTVDGLDGIVAAASLAKEVPPQVNVPATIRLAPPNLRKVAPWDSDVKENGGTLALMLHPAYKKLVQGKKTGKCLAKVEKENRGAFLDELAKYSALPPMTMQDDLEKAAEPVKKAWDAFVSARAACLGDVWTGMKEKMTNKEKTEALFMALNQVRKAFGQDEVPIPVELPAILPVPPPPPPPQPAQPQPQPQPAAQPAPQPAEKKGEEVIGPSSSGGSGSTAKAQPAQQQPAPPPPPPPKQEEKKKESPPPTNNPLIPPPSGNEEVIGPTPSK